MLTLMSNSEAKHDVTRVLQSQESDAAASQELLPLVYKELRELAVSRMAREMEGQTLQPTALVHEAWLRLDAPLLVEVPGSSGRENENGTIRRSAVPNNYTDARISWHDLSAGRHTLEIHAVDPGAVIDAISLP